VYIDSRVNQLCPRSNPRESVVNEAKMLKEVRDWINWTEIKREITLHILPSFTKF
jgi:hypothetical protein